MPENIVNARIELRNDDTANWSTQVLRKGEVGIEFVTGGGAKMKVGDGTSTWSQITKYIGDSQFVPLTRTINNKSLSSNITLSASDISAVPTSRTINNKSLTSDITISASDIGAISTSGGTISGALKITGTASEGNLMTRGIRGANQQATAVDDVYLNYDTEYGVKMGKTAQCSVDKDGNIVTSGNSTGAKLRTTSPVAMTSTATKVCVLDSEGYIATRTPAQVAEDIGAATITVKRW